MKIIEIFRNEIEKLAENGEVTLPFSPKPLGAGRKPGISTLPRIPAANVASQKNLLNRR